MKKWIIRIVVGVVALVVIALVVVFFNLNSIVKKGVETVGPMLTKVDVKLGSANISPMSGSGELSKLFVGNPEGYKAPSAIEVDNIKVAVKIGSVLSDVIVVDEVNIQAPEITFEGGFGGNNLSQILKNLEGAPDDAKPETKEKSSSKPGKKFFVKDVVVNGGKIHVSISGMAGNAVSVPLPPIHLTNIGTEKEGVSAAQLCKEILKPIISSSMKAGTEALTGLGGSVKDLGKGAADKTGKAMEGIKGIFKK